LRWAGSPPPPTKIPVDPGQANIPDVDIVGRLWYRERTGGTDPTRTRGDRLSRPALSSPRSRGPGRDDARRARTERRRQVDAAQVDARPAAAHGRASRASARAFAAG